MKNILLIGLGRFGKHIALQLNKLGHEVMAVDSNEERVNEILPIVTNAQIGDSTKMCIRDRSHAVPPHGFCAACIFLSHYCGNESS